jgi:NNP family nitrate/nitrite transporter-like MFS transporter
MMVSFVAWALIGGLAPRFAALYNLSASATALLVAVPVLLGSLARLPVGMLTDRFGGRMTFTAVLLFGRLDVLLWRLRQHGLGPRAR